MYSLHYNPGAGSWQPQGLPRGRLKYNLISAAENAAATRAFNHLTSLSGQTRSLGSE